MLLPLALLAIAALWWSATFAARLLRLAVAKRATRRLAALTSQQVATHAATLVGKYERCVHRDEYGTPRFGDMDREIAAFLRSTVLPKARPGDIARVAHVTDPIDLLRQRVYADLDAIHLPAHDVRDVERPIPSGHRDFEAWCAQVLGEHGWAARVTKAGGDHGADVVAERGGVRIVVQCKRWTHTVGNGAVQEVAAARAHFGAQQGVVVSASGFTPAARQLAQTNDVVLIDAIDFPTAAATVN